MLGSWLILIGVIQLFLRYIPNEYDYYLEPVVLSGDKYGLTTPIIGEECGHIYKCKLIIKFSQNEWFLACSKRRRRNSQVSRTSKYCLFFYADRDKILNTEKQCFDVQTAIYKAGVKIKRTAEYELRSSIQFLLRNGELSQLFLSHPLIQYVSLRCYDNCHLTCFRKLDKESLWIILNFFQQSRLLTLHVFNRRQQFRSNWRFQKLKKCWLK